MTNPTLQRCVRSFKDKTICSRKCKTVQTRIKVKHQHPSERERLIDSGVMKPTGGAWCCCQRSAVTASPRLRPPCIFYHGGVWKAIQWNHQREGKDVAGVLSSLTSPHLRGHRGTDTLLIFSAAPVSGTRPFQKPALLLRRPNNSYCLSRPTYSKQGGGPVINKKLAVSRRGPHSPPTLPFEVGRHIKEFNLHWHVCTTGPAVEKRVQRGTVELHTEQKHRCSAFIY